MAREQVASDEDVTAAVELNTATGEVVTVPGEVVAASGDAVTAGRSGWRTLWDTPLALLAVAAIPVSHTAMIGLMSLTPVHMDHGGASLRLVGLAISLHVAGMYALSPVFGWLADRSRRLPGAGR